MQYLTLKYEVGNLPLSKQNDSGIPVRNPDFSFTGKPNNRLNLPKSARTRDAAIVALTKVEPFYFYRQNYTIGGLMSIINSAPSKAVDASARLLFCEDQIDICSDLLDTLQRSILTNPEKLYHTDAWITSIIQQELISITAEIKTARKQISGGIE